MRVTVYTTGPSCMHCNMTKSVMSKEGVEFDEVDVRDNLAAREYITDELGCAEAPVCVAEDGTGEDHWSGFRPDRITGVARAVVLGEGSEVAHQVSGAVVTS